MEGNGGKWKATQDGNEGLGERGELICILICMPTLLLFYGDDVIRPAISSIAKNPNGWVAFWVQRTSNTVDQKKYFQQKLGTTVDGWQMADAVDKWAARVEKKRTSWDGPEHAHSISCSSRPEPSGNILTRAHLAVSPESLRGILIRFFFKVHSILHRCTEFFLWLTFIQRDFQRNRLLRWLCNPTSKDKRYNAAANPVKPRWTKSNFSKPSKTR